MFDFYFNTTFVLLACPKDQDRIRSFGLTQKNQKVKAHTPEATLSVAALKSRKTRLRLKQPRFFNAPLGRPLYASFVRPNQWTIDNSFSTDFMEFICWTYYMSRGAACCASSPTRQDKTTNNTINPFVILLIVIWLYGTPF